jgi:hypothetical protein
MEEQIPAIAAQPLVAQETQTEDFSDVLEIFK